MSFETPRKTKVEAMAAIDAIRNQIHVMGANDSEFRDLDTLKEELEAGRITPEEAILKAQGIMDSKQDYH